MKTYVCHKKVKGFKIVGVKFHATITELYGAEGESVNVPESFQRHMTGSELIGGYYVLYEDGYSSWSPAKAFEEGYTEE